MGKAVLDDPNKRQMLLDSIANGMPQTTAMKQLGITSAMLRRYVKKNTDFGDDIADAKALGYAPVQDVIMAVAMTPEHPQWIQAVKELGRRLAPVVEPVVQIEHNHSHTLDNIDTIKELENRIKSRLELVESTHTFDPRIQKGDYNDREGDESE